MLYPIELQARKKSICNDNGGYVSLAETHPPSLQKLLLPTNTVNHEADRTLHHDTRTETRRLRLPAQNNGRYKTRTCDLHDVNVAL
jgi:hypothetical protein